MGYFAKEGYPWMFIGIFVTVASYINTISPEHPKILYFIIWTLPMILVTLFLIFFFRDPKRDFPSNYNMEKTILCPADGHLCAIEKEGGNLTFYIEMHATNMHVTRAHKSGYVKKIERVSGKNYPVYYLRKKKGRSSEAIRKNARVNIDMVDEDGQEFNYQLICGKLARRAKPYVKEGQRIKAGQKMGIIMFGSLVKVTVPGTNYKLVANVGDKVKAKKYVLCEKVPKQTLKERIEKNQYDDGLGLELLPPDLEISRQTIKYGKRNRN